MITLDDCIALSELTREEIAAIAEHEHIPEIVAAELGDYILHRPDGVVCLRRMLIDDIHAARRRGEFVHAARLKLLLRHFIKHHAQGDVHLC